jgi:hypothetical protein
MIRECNVSVETPRTKFACMRRESGIVIGKPFSQVNCSTNVISVRKRLALQYIDVFQWVGLRWRCPPTPRLRRDIRLRAQPYGRPGHAGAKRRRMVGAAGFEPATCSTQNCRATRLRYTPPGSPSDTRFPQHQQAPGPFRKAPYNAGFMAPCRHGHSAFLNHRQLMKRHDRRAARATQTLNVRRRSNRSRGRRSLSQASGRCPRSLRGRRGPEQ